MKLFALVITYKNVDSLKKCLNRLFVQSGFIDRIIVVNNHSEDGTEAYLKSLGDKVEVLDLDRNYGGAGGYHYGLKHCVETGADWVWCVEDDIFSSRNFARNFRQLNSDHYQDLMNVGFLYPKVISILSRNKMDGFISIKQPIRFHMNLALLEKAQFAGCLINAIAVKRAGLPLKEFFIYYDDWEFTQRIIRNGFYGLWLKDSFVWHNADETRLSKPYLTRRKQDIWKNFYGIRNELFILRKGNFYAFMKPFLCNLIYVPIIILLKRRDSRLYVALNWFLWTVKSLFLKATIVFPEVKLVN